MKDTNILKTIKINTCKELHTDDKNLYSRDSLLILGFDQTMVVK